MIDLTAEREAHRKRERIQQSRRMAASVVYHFGIEVDRVVVIASAQERWKLTDEEAEAVADRVEDLRNTGDGGPRHLSTEEFQVQEALMQEKTERIREATREVLKANPDIKRQDAHEEVLKKLGPGVELKDSYFEVSFFYPIRKDFRASGEIPAPEKKAQEDVEPKPKRRPRRKRPDRYDPAPAVPISSPEVPLREESPAEEEKPKSLFKAFGPSDGSPTHGPSHLTGAPTLEPMSETEIRLLQRLAELEKEHRELEIALKVISRLNAA